MFKKIISEVIFEFLRGKGETSKLRELSLGPSPIPTFGPIPHMELGGSSVWIFIDVHALVLGNFFIPLRQLDLGSELSILTFTVGILSPVLAEPYFFTS